jgi:glutamate--cysteine ligase
MGFERWVDYALDVPMYFIKRGDQYIDVAGQSFRELLAGKLASHPSERATLSDWSNHISTIFPEVRLKRYLEMRGSDVGARERLPALPALWVGLLYDETALDAAWDLVKNWTAHERQQLRDDVPRLGFKATIRGRSLRELAHECLTLARAGLARRKQIDSAGQDETKYLAPLELSVERGVTPAEDLLEKYHGPWRGSVAPAFDECAY